MDWIYGLIGLIGDCDLRRVEKPTAVPRATGTRIARAGEEKTFSGRVMEGMYAAMIAVVLLFLLTMMWFMLWLSEVVGADCDGMWPDCWGDERTM